MTLQQPHCNRSTKLTNIIHSIQALNHDCACLRSLCPTRVLVRWAALKTVQDQHEFRRCHSMRWQAVEKLRLKPEAYSNRSQVVNLSWRSWCLFRQSTCSKTSTRLFSLEASPFLVLWSNGSNVQGSRRSENGRSISWNIFLLYHPLWRDGCRGS